MIGVLLVALAGGGAYVGARRSLLNGLIAVISVGYFYGIVRANVTGILTYFLFDVAVLAFYAGTLQRGFTPADRERFRPLVPWVGVFILWTMVLLVLQRQDPLVQLVGARGHLFFLPFLLVGAMLLPGQMYRLALWIAGLNLTAFGFAVAEFFLGVERFYPYQEGITTIIYRSTDLTDFAFRIPAIFGNAHLYGGTMVITLPILIGAWVQEHRRWWHGYLLMLAIACSALGVFMAAARINMLLLAVLGLVALTSGVLGGRMKLGTQIGAVGILGIVAWIVSTDTRLQRFTMLFDVQRVVQRLEGSINQDLVSGMLRFPLGNGLGGGGTNMPPFLQGRVMNLVVMENEYARIVLELGLPGLLLWFAFLGWVFTRPTIHRREGWFLGRRLAWFAALTFFASGILGMGLLMAVPQAPLLLLILGWVAVRQPRPHAASGRIHPAARVPPVGATAVLRG